MNTTAVKETPAGLVDFVDRRQIKLILVDDEEDFREAARSYFSRLGYDATAADDGETALAALEERGFDVAVVDIHMPRMSGIDLLERIRQEDPELKVIMLTGGGTIENAVESMKKGAFDFLTKPAKLNELDLLIQKAYRSRQLEKENRQLRHIVKQFTSPFNMIGKSAAMQEVFRLIDKTAGTSKPVLIQGESGTGKELVARAIHERSALADKPLVVINCAALPEALLESELFGHEKGAFTGAAAAKPGLFEIADGATLFIDECGELAGGLQAKLLRVLEDGTFRRIGSVKERKVNVRLIAATNRDLNKEVAAGRFREDLFYRINVLTIHLPPLRERDGDTELLIRHFVGEQWHIADDLLKLLSNYSWPGNVRQLLNAIERAKILADSDWITRENLPSEIIHASQEVAAIDARTKPDLETINRIHIQNVYEKNQRNKSRTARVLGIGRRSLYRLLEKYGIE
jgi:DNA-binding NtrC family response regulator